MPQSPAIENRADFEVLVIGGGIQGAGCAQAAAAAGYRTCLLEQHHWASGTSSRSSKLIHGGLRYLETGQFGLVSKAVRERRLLLRLAPSLVKPVPFHIPVYRRSRRRPWQLMLGLGCYAVLGGFDALSRFRRVPRREWPQLAGLATDGLRAVFRYWDAQTDDRLLTRAVVASAVQLGATAQEGVHVTGAMRDRHGYRVRCLAGGRELLLHSRVLINAAGPWAAALQPRIESSPPAPPMELVKGTHVELAGRISGAADFEAVYYLESPLDGRALFVMPWRGNTLVGTTESAFEGDPATVAVDPAEIRYLLQAVRWHFPDFQPRLVDSFAGLRVLPKGDGRFAARPRETLVQYDDAARPRLATLYGGKLTTYRATAEEVIARLRPVLGARPGARSTATLPLTGAAASAPAPSFRSRVPERAGRG